MPIIVGVVLATIVAVFAALVRLDRDRAFYPTVTIVVASYYGLFAVMGGSLSSLAGESVPIALFILASVVGFKRSPWIVAAALFGHGVFDLFHDRIIPNPGVPLWWPPFCSAYDIVAAAGLALILSTRKDETTDKARNIETL